jgi:ribosome-binding protein aMBF1 (putative translation factor)
MSEKIGMCCMCGAYADKSKTVFVAGMEVCPSCADMVGGADDSAIPAKPKARKRRKAPGDIYNPRDIAILGGDPSL